MTWKKIVVQKLTRKWMKLLILKPKVYKRAGGRPKRSRSEDDEDDNDDDGNYTAPNASEMVEMAAAAARPLRRSNRRSNPNPFLNREVAKYFDEVAYYGKVTSYEEQLEDGTQAQWHILYSDGDEEDLYESELKDAMKLWNELNNGNGEHEM